MQQGLPGCMFKMGVPEKLMLQHTGHCSLDSLRVYEQASADQQEAVSEVLSTSLVLYSDCMFGFL